MVGHGLLAFCHMMKIKDMGFDLPSVSCMKQLCNKPATAKLK